MAFEREDESSDSGVQRPGRPGVLRQNMWRAIVNARRMNSLMAEGGSLLDLERGMVLERIRRQNCDRRRWCCDEARRG
jgi:hypothetical protein